jgi:hypothetical protein
MNTSIDPDLKELIRINGYIQPINEKKRSKK